MLSALDIEMIRQIIREEIKNAEAKRVPAISPEFFDMIGKFPDRIVAETAGVSWHVARQWRIQLGISPARKMPPDPRVVKAVEEQKKAVEEAERSTQERVMPLLGIKSDAEIAREVGVSRARIGQIRNKLGIPVPPVPHYTNQKEIKNLDQVLPCLGVEPDYIIGGREGVSPGVITRLRRARGIAPASGYRKPAPEVKIAHFDNKNPGVIGIVPDFEIAKIAKVSNPDVVQFRKVRGIKSAREAYSARIEAAYESEFKRKRDWKKRFPQYETLPRTMTIDVDIRLSTMADEEIAKQLNLPPNVVAFIRELRK